MITGLLKEIDLPECLGVRRHELVPGTGAPLRSWVDVLLLEDLSYRRSTHALDAELLQLSNDSAVAPARFFGQADDDFSDRLGGSFTAHLLGWLLAISYLALPPLVRSWADDRDDFENPSSYGPSQLQQPLTLIVVEEDAVLRDPPAEHLVLRFEKLDLFAELVLGRTCQQEE